MRTPIALGSEVGVKVKEKFFFTGERKVGKTLNIFQITIDTKEGERKKEKTTKAPQKKFHLFNLPTPTSIQLYSARLTHKS
jgi:hypothetical protein